LWSSNAFEVKFDGKNVCLQNVSVLVDGTSARVLPQQMETANETSEWPADGNLFEI
jgi:hypothetical protein